jgi:hypothetical protein
MWFGNHFLQSFFSELETRFVEMAVPHLIRFVAPPVEIAPWTPIDNPAPIIGLKNLAGIVGITARAGHHSFLLLLAI